MIIMTSMYPPYQPIFMKLGMYIMALEPFSTVNIRNPSYQSVCLYVYPLSFLGNGSVKRFRRQEYTCKSTRKITVVGVIFYAVRVV
jgi:hypothetical protein